MLVIDKHAYENHCGDVINTEDDVLVEDIDVDMMVIFTPGNVTAKGLVKIHGITCHTFTLEEHSEAVLKTLRTKVAPVVPTGSILACNNKQIVV